MEATFNKGLQDKLARRNSLKELSNRLVDQAREAGNVNISANYVLIVYYKSKGCTLLKSYEAWKEEGYAVRQGSQGYPIWGSRQSKQRPDGSTIEFCPVRYLFDESQVIKMN